ncbi:MAG: hypothetical protein A3H96_18030 [Acidobacteria bacterium RIFCSPLOWO2_02_FULL_67_36]|nr:MAG: hypothetical protein A3H96_18030 [Acidobacteria bacterium RIFCSPLOWO2_02_FULL_67_36]OFW23865.1 MAG: hypothetical protein A3G21_02965 [Acidobacteria bacterium RIFCSPLOWO2_12_FULL_66_21]
MTDHNGSSRFRLLWRPAIQRIARREGTSAPGDWRVRVRARVLVGAALFAAWTVGIEARLVYLQVIRQADMMALADQQQLLELKQPAKRGEIVDRNRRVLATSIDTDTVAANPSTVGDPENTARLVCRALGDCGPKQERAMVEKLSGAKRFAYLARRISPDQARRVKALDLPGLYFPPKESRRYYPNMELAAHVLGYVGIDNEGLEGLEHTFDARMRGREGRMLIQTDLHRNAILTRDEQPPTAGDDLELTIDQYLQFVAERELRAGVEDNNAAGGTAIVMQPQTGEILAMANWPTFNPNAFSRVADDAKRNRAVQDLYEPGSTFKVVTASAALEEHVIAPADPVDCSPGYITFGSRVIRDTHHYSVLPFTDVIVKSSNVGAIKVGQRLGSERLSRYISRFGFGQALAPDFRGENPGLVWNPARLDASALASVSMGYQIGVTPLQMATAVSSVANGGTLVEPRVVRAFVRDGHREEVPHKTLRRTITPDTAAILTEMMEGVVERGTATAAQIPGYTIAGKTGTSHKVINRRYSDSEYYASFVGFVPSRHPALTIIVVIDSPHGHGYYGGTVAAPVFRRVAEAALRHLGVGPTLNAPPPVLVARHDAEDNTGGPRAVVAPAVASRPMEQATAGLMPDLRGLSAREALRALVRIGMSARMEGAGFVADQTPAPGAALPAGDACVLKLRRRPLSAPVGGSPQ